MQRMIPRHVDTCIMAWMDREIREGGTCPDASESSQEITGEGDTPRQRLQPFALSLIRTATFGQM